MRRATREVQFRRDTLIAWVYLAERNRFASEKWKAELAKTVLRVCETPTLGHRRPDVPDELSAIAIGSYIAIYRVEPERIVFVRLIHGARDFSRIFTKQP